MEDDSPRERAVRERAILGVGSVARDRYLVARPEDGSVTWREYLADGRTADCNCQRLERRIDTIRHGQSCRVLTARQIRMSRVCLGGARAVSEGPAIAQRASLGVNGSGAREAHGQRRWALHRICRHDDSGRLVSSADVPDSPKRSSIERASCLVETQIEVVERAVGPLLQLDRVPYLRTVKGSIDRLKVKTSGDSRSRRVQRYSLDPVLRIISKEVVADKRTWVLASSVDEASHDRGVSPLMGIGVDGICYARRAADAFTERPAVVSTSYDPIEFLEGG